MLMDREAIGDAYEVVKPEHFHSGKLRTIYEAILSLYEKAVEVDPVTLSEELKRRGSLSEIGGARYIFEVAGSVATAANVVKHAEIVKEKSRVRELYHLAGAIIERMKSPVEDTTELFQWAEGTMLGIRDNEAGQGMVQVKDLLDEFISDLHTRRDQGGHIYGLSTGYYSLDRLTSGLIKQEVVVLAARPGQGKTALALNIAYNLASSADKIPVLFFSLEMSKRQLVQRLVSMITGIDLYHITNATLTSEQMSKIDGAMQSLWELPLHIDDTPGLTPLDLLRIARRAKKRQGIKLIAVDYLQKVRAHERGRTREQEVSAAINMTTHIAKEIDVPVLVLSQLNRGFEDHADGIPRLSDLRESGAIEQDAHQVWFVVREKAQDLYTGAATIYVEKNRNGRCGDAGLTFVDTCVRFDNPADERQEYGY
jgi:replicative DNA helicase